MKAIYLYSEKSGKLLSASDYYPLESAPSMGWIKSFTGSGKTGKWNASPPAAESSDFLLVRNYPLPPDPKTEAV